MRINKLKKAWTIRLDQQASQEAASIERQYQEMDDVQIMRGVVYEPTE
ncbi:MAG: hypothetical protein ACFNQI_02620 [Eikenella corrodens]